MITEFSLDKEFFASGVLNNESLSVVHDFLTNAWLNAGVMVIPQGGGNGVLELIDKLPSKFRQRWVEAFEYGKKCEVDCEWWKFGDYDSFESLCKLNNYFKTAFSDDAVSYVFCGDDSYIKTCQKTGFEILGAGVCSESKNLSAAIMLSSADILESETPVNVWNTRFKSLAQHSKKITIIDRYIFDSVWRAAGNKCLDESVKNFFIFLAQLRKKFNVKIISHGSYKDSDFHTAIHDSFYNYVYKVPALKDALNSLTLVSTSEDFFKRESHDRFIGFDSHICQIGNGMRVLGATPIPRSTFHAKFDRDGELSRRETSSRSREFKLWEEQF